MIHTRINRKQTVFLFYLLIFGTVSLFSQMTFSLSQDNAKTMDISFGEVAGTSLKYFGVDMLMTFDTSMRSAYSIYEGENSVGNSNNQPSNQIATSLVSAPLGSAQYRLGPGDQVSFYLWGESIDVTLIQNPTFPVVQTLPVSTDGAILYPGVGRFDVRGRTLSEVRDLVRAEMAKKYRKFDLGISLVQSRNQLIWITGYVNKPGQREIPPNSSLLEALATAGGPSDGGSLRNITVYRSTTDETFNVDLYPLLLGEKSLPFSLGDGDRVMVGPKAIVVGISGAVLRPAIYEFLTPPTLQEVIKMAGGVTPFATEKIKVLQPAGQGFEDLSIDAQGTQKLISGALAVVPSRSTNLAVSNKLGDYVSEFPVLVGGAVQKAGMINIAAGTKLSQVLDSAGGYGPDAYPEGLVLQRQSVRTLQQKQALRLLTDLEKQKKDLELLSLSAVASDQSGVSKEVAAKLKVVEQNIEYLNKVLEDDSLGRIALQIPPQVSLLANDAVNNIVLEPGDTVFVPKRPSHVLVFGNTFQQSSFPFMEGKRVRDYIYMAGGANTSGDLGEIYLIKASGQVRSPRSSPGFLWFRPDPLNEVISPGDVIVVPAKTAFEEADWLDLTNRTLNIVSSALTIGLNSVQLYRVLGF